MWITRTLGILYLWIDAIRIKQDIDNVDWHHEVPNMGDIYKHSLFTVAASSAADSDEGFFSRDEAALLPVNDFRLVDRKEFSERPRALCRRLVYHLGS